MKKGKFEQGAEAMVYVKYDREEMEEMKLSGTHQRGLKTLGGCWAGTGTKSEEFLGNIGHSSKKEKWNKKDSNEDRG